MIFHFIWNMTTGFQVGGGGGSQHYKLLDAFWCVSRHLCAFGPHFAFCGVSFHPVRFRPFSTKSANSQNRNQLVYVDIVVLLGNTS